MDNENKLDDCSGDLTINEDKLDPEILDRIEAEENECVGCGEKHDNPYRHIEEANEENYKAEENK